MNLFFVYFAALCGLLPTIDNLLHGLTNHYRENIPRFKHAVNERNEVFLGDEVKFDCQIAPSKIPAKVEWYRNEKLVREDRGSVFRRFKKDDSRLILHVKFIDVSDQGMWSCRVHNAYGQIMRNFTVEVIDFCDYFLIPEIHHSRIPMECVCLWRYNKEPKRPDVDFRAATAEACKKYADRMIHRARRPFDMLPCLGDHCEGFNSTPFLNFEFPKDDDENSTIMHVVLKEEQDLALQDSSSSESINSQKTEYINAGDDDDEDDEHYRKAVSPDAELTELNVTVDEPPYFNSHDDYVLFNETHAIPTGRTLHLNCRAKGWPEPEIYWFKNGKQLDRGSSRAGGYDFKFKRWSLEAEDAVTADSGDYHCEAHNDAGMARKFFHVLIVNRMRRPPIIVPNILQNATVNINDTATFNCKVVSDLHPHITWVRVNRINGSYTYFNTTADEFMFNYTEMETVEKAHVHHIGDESTLTILNVSIEDQGTYACLSGNSLGMSMANATLTVNEFRAIHLLTGDEPRKPQKWTTLDYFLTTFLILGGIFLTIFALIMLFCKETLKEKGILEDTVGLVARKKRVVISKRTEGGENGDGPTQYQIQIIETPMTKKEAAKRRKKMTQDGALLSDYEVDCDTTWEIERSRLNLVSLLGEGAFGEVWKATLNDKDDKEIEVAVKKLKLSAHEKELIDLVSEMETFKVIGTHKNVLRLIGCSTGIGPLYMVVELCKHGNLRDFLRAHRPKEDKVKKSSQELTDYLETRRNVEIENVELIPNLTQRHLVHFAWQVAQGMNFLAEKKIVHRDLAARNVLVSEGHVMKISDFGLSRDVNQENYYRKRGNGRLPIKWMALEALDSNVYTIESDVWSYGVLLWEIMTLGGTPYPTIAMPALYETLKNGYRMEAPHLCPIEVYQLMQACWQAKLEDRPSFKMILDYLDWMLTMTHEAISASQELKEQNLSDRSSPVNPLEIFKKNRRRRPLSAPVVLPSGPMHTICDEYDTTFLNLPVNAQKFGNDNPLADHIITPETSQLYIHDETNGNGYVRHENLVRAISGVANQSLDSALGSPAWPPYDRSTNKASLDPSHQYYNTTSKIQYLHFTFDENDSMTRSRDSAIYEEAYHPNYVQSHPLYSKIILKKHMTPRNSLPTKETIV